MKISIIAGARPNFMKIAPIVHAIKGARAHGQIIDYRLVHTGQHYDSNMSQVFFDELDMPEPDVNFGVGSGTQAEQTAAIMIAFERELMENLVDIVLVVGDVTSTMACSIVAKKLNIKVAHVEAGIRSFDPSMPEEINRMVTDSITDYYFTTSEFANRNLKNIGVSEDRIFFVGNVMIDTLLANQHHFKKPEIFDTLGLKEKQYFVLTMHRPANVDEIEKLGAFIFAITENVQGLPVIFPIHPRTAGVLKNSGINNSNLIVINPMGYLEFNYLVSRSKAVITDSGGITEETTVMGIPCMTLRDNTERPETCTLGTNILVGTNPGNIGSALERLFAGKWQVGSIPDLWDGKAGIRIVNHLIALEKNG